MILLHSADWHLGKRLENHARLPEQAAFLEEFCALADREQADAILIAGDIFDHFQPSNEASGLFYRTLSRLSLEGTRPVVVIAGNHDSPEFLRAPSDLARELGVILIGFPREQPDPYLLESGVELSCPAPGLLVLQLPGHPPLRIIATPYANALRLRTVLDPDQPEAALSQLLGTHWAQLAEASLDDQGCNLLITHLYVAADPKAPEPEPEDERPILYIGGIPALAAETIPPQVQYAALGHLHRPHQVPHPAGVPVVYSGSPVSYSFAEAHQQKQVVRIELHPGRPASWDFLPVHSGRALLRFRTDDPEEALRFLLEHPEAFVELTLVCGGFIPPEWKNRLEAAHERVFLVPEISDTGADGPGGSEPLHLDRLEDVFSAFFRERTGQDPDPAITDLFRELLQTGES